MSDVARDSDIGRRRRDRAVDALERVEGVIAATVQLGAGNRVDAVRLATTATAAPDSVRDRALAILRELGFEIDRAAITMAASGEVGSLPADTPTPTGATGQPPAPHSAPTHPAASARTGAATDPDDIDDSTESFVDAKAPPPAWHGRFLVLDGVEVRRADARVTCTVRLKRLGDSFSAEVQELDTPQGRARAAARAALLAAEKSGEGVGLSLEGVVLQEFFGRQYVLAFVDGIAHRRFASLSGILAVEQSLETAAALAILRAVERWVAW